VSDDEWYKPHRTPTPPRQQTPGELLFEFVRERDHKHFRCELRFHGESYGWEAQFLVGIELLYAHGGFITRAGAIRWAERERKMIQVHR